MEIKITPEDVKFAIMCEIFRQTGMRLKYEDVDIEVTDGYMTMVNNFSCVIKVKKDGAK